MKYNVFEDWMIGRKVVELSSGDRGIVLSGYTSKDVSVWVDWTTGVDAGLKLHISLGDLEFIEESYINDWQPIETAPKDGTKVDLWWVSVVFDERACRIPDCWYSFGAWRHDQGKYGFPEIGEKITHWKPITSPPKSS